MNFDQEFKSFAKFLNEIVKRVEREAKLSKKQPKRIIDQPYMREVLEDALMAAKRQLGWSYTAIGDYHGVSETLVHSRIERYLRLLATVNNDVLNRYKQRTGTEETEEGK